LYDNRYLQVITFRWIEFNFVLIDSQDVSILNLLAF